MLEYQSNYKMNERKIILDKSVYARLLGTINYTGFKMNMTDKSTAPNGGFEYIVILYGKTLDNGDIVFSKTNQADYESYDGKSKMFQKDLIDELFSNMNESDYNCCAFVHTHPYGKTESSRIFSEADISYYKTTFKSSNFSKAFKKDIINLGGVMTIGAENIPQDDDISFVYYNEKEDEMEYLPNIYVELNDKLMPLNQTQEKLYIDELGKVYNSHQKESNKQYSSMDINRTFIELVDEENGKTR